MIYPDSAFTEFNACHAPDTGQFCAGTGHKGPHAKAFKKWFSGSVVVDPKGEPLVLYHGTPANFMSFAPGGVSDKGMPSGPAIWLSPTPAHIPAAHHIGGFDGNYRTGTNIIPVYARVTKPLRVDDNNVAQLRKEMGLNGEFPLLITPKSKKILDKAGYDGVFYNSVNGNEVIVFRPAQLKSAIANRGTYRRTLTSLVEAHRERLRAVIPDSAFTEHNPYHGPDGRFTSKAGARGATAGPANMVGITSVRPEATDPEHYAPNATVAQEMRRMERELKGISGVTRVKVQPALGQWGDGDEFSWSVSYDGNGEATRLMAAVGKRWNQDGVLLIKRAKPGEPQDSMWEMEFPAVDLKTRRALAPVMSKHLSGWTWFKRGGKTVLRSVAVPSWGGQSRPHILARPVVAAAFAKAGLTPKASRRIYGYRTETMGRDGANSYDVVLGQSPRFDRR